MLDFVNSAGWWAMTVGGPIFMFSVIAYTVFWLGWNIYKEGTKG